MNTRDRLQAIRERCRKATPGPWEVEQNEVRAPGCRCLSCYEPVCGEWVVSANDDMTAGADAEFIAHAREDMPRLLDAVEVVLLACERNPFAQWADNIKMCIKRTLEENND